MKNIDYKGLLNWQKEEKDFQLIDVREISEHEHFNIGGQNIPLSEVVKETNQLELSKPIVMYCKRGIRSQIAIQRLKIKFPETEFYNLDKGIYHLSKPN